MNLKYITILIVIILLNSNCFAQSKKQLKALISGKDARIGHFEDRLEEKDNIIKEKDNIIKAKDKIIKDLKWDVKWQGMESDRKNKALNDSLEAKNERIRMLEKELDSYKKDPKNKTIKYKDLLELQKIRKSNSILETPPNQKPSSSKKSNYNTECSSSQCTGRTQSRSRCRNKTTNCSGRCHLH